MYADTNPRTKRELAEQVASGRHVGAYQPGPFGPNVSDGWHSCEGPHYPEAHRWYARVRVESGRIVEVQGVRTGPTKPRVPRPEYYRVSGINADGMPVTSLSSLRHGSKSEAIAAAQRFLRIGWQAAGVLAVYPDRSERVAAWAGGNGYRRPFRVTHEAFTVMMERALDRAAEGVRS